MMCSDGLISVETFIIIPYDQLVLARILRQVTENFAEIANLVGFIIWVVHKFSLKLLV